MVLATLASPEIGRIPAISNLTCNPVLRVRAGNANYSATRLLDLSIGMGAGQSPARPELVSL